MIRRNLITAALVGVALTPAASFAQVTELTLYGVALKNASAAELTEGAKKAGAKPNGKSKDGLPQFDTKGTGVPALESFTLLADAGKVVTVQFAVKGYGPENEMLRKMLVQKYGKPIEGRADQFTGEYYSDGTVSWRFAGGMKLTYAKPFIGTPTLSYVDEAAFKALMARVEGAADRDASVKASAVKNKF